MSPHIFSGLGRNIKIMLSEKSLDELKIILQKELGAESFKDFDDDLFNDFGNRLLKIAVLVLKTRTRWNSKSIITSDS